MEFVQIITIITAVLGSTGLFTFIQFLINRKDSKKRESQNRICSSEAQLTSINMKLDSVTSKIDELSKDSCRTQLMLLIKSYPTKVDEIMILAKKYFCDLKGNSYMVTLFNDWLAKKNLEKPEWFNF